MALFIAGRVFGDVDNFRIEFCIVVKGTSTRKNFQYYPFDDDFPLRPEENIVKESLSAFLHSLSLFSLLPSLSNDSAYYLYSILLSFFLSLAFLLAVSRYGRTIGRLMMIRDFLLGETEQQANSLTGNSICLLVFVHITTETSKRMFVDLSDDDVRVKDELN